jgi:hypothetical protein
MRFLFLFLLLFSCFLACAQNASVNQDKQDCVQQTYLSQLHVREASGKNDGKAVEAYLAVTKMPKGQPWCAAFVCWTFTQCGIPNPKNAFSPALFRNRFTVYTRGETNTYAFQRGDVFGLFYTNLNRIGHVGFIHSENERFYVTVEGNTNQAGSREGDGVYRKRRPKKTIYKISRYI